MYLTSQLELKKSEKEASTPEFVIVKLSLSKISCNHASKSHVYTDVSTASDNSAGYFVVPSHLTMKTFELSYKTSSAASELVEIHQAF